MEKNFKQNILLVDDRPENLLVLISVLEDPERNFIEACSGEEALKLLLKHEVSLILLDVQMPGIDGFETAQLIRGKQKTKHIPIIFVTAISKEQKHIFKGYQAGAVDYLPKPIDSDILKSKVNIFLDLDRQRTIVKHQNEALEAAKINTDNILNNINDGVFLVNKDIEIKPEYSLVTSQIFDRDDLAEKNLLSILDKKISKKNYEDINIFFEVIFKKDISEEVITDLNPFTNIEYTGNGSSGEVKNVK